MTQNAQVIHNEAEHRYELQLNGQVVGSADYRPQGDILIFTHTVVEEGHKGQGLGSKRVQAALDDTRAGSCPPVRSWPPSSRNTPDTPIWWPRQPRQRRCGLDPTDPVILQRRFTLDT